MQEIASAGSQGQREAFAAWAALMLKEFKHMHYTLHRDRSPSLVTQHFVCDLLEERAIESHKLGTNTCNSSCQKRNLNTAVHMHAYILTEKHWMHMDRYG